MSEDYNSAELGLRYSTLATKLAWASKQVAAVNLANGWYDSERTFGDDIALLHSEVSEAFEAYRIDGNVAMNSATGLYNKDAVGAELADVLIRLLDTCHRYGVDLGLEFGRKLDYNRERPYRHGDKAL